MQKDNSRILIIMNLILIVSLNMRDLKFPMMQLLCLSVGLVTKAFC